MQPAQRRVVSRERPQESSRDCIEQKRHTTAVLTKKALIAQILRREGGSSRGERRMIAKTAKMTNQRMPTVRMVRRGLADQKMEAET